LLPVGAIWNDRFGSLLVQVRAKLVAIIRLVPKQAFGRLHAADQALGERTIVRFASG